MELLRTALVFFASAAVLIPGAWCLCDAYNYAKCLGSDQCFYRTSLCDGYGQCTDGTDERFCNKDAIVKEGGCPEDWWMCESQSKCIPKQWKCDDYPDCYDKSDERICVYKGKRLLSEWFLKKWSEIESTNSRIDLSRLVVALHLMDTYGSSEPKQAMAEKLRLQILSEMATEEYLNYDELALSIHALLVTCSGDPRDFHGYNLVSELRDWTKGKKLRPFDLLALCNAGDDMTPQDAQTAENAFNSKEWAFTTDTQAMALLALSCIRSKTNSTFQKTNVTSEMEKELKRGQFGNGTFGNLRTTALVLQALLSTQSINQSDFNYSTTLNAILEGQNRDGSFGSLLDSYYMAPVLNDASLTDINNSHCSKKDDGSSVPQYRKKTPRYEIRYSIKMPGQKTKTQDLFVPANSSLYDVIEIMNLIDSTQKVQYNVVNNKPYVSSLKGVQDDIEKGTYWNIYQQGEFEERDSINKSPADIRVIPRVEYTLWYKSRE